MPTPSDHIDIMINTNATALATIVMLVYISIKSTVSPPSRRNYEFSGAGHAGPAVPRSCLLQREVHRHGHDDRHRCAVEQGRGELPLLHRIQRCLIEQRD